MLGPTFEVECQEHHGYRIQMGLNIVNLWVREKFISTLVATYDCDQYRDCLAKRNIVAFGLFEYVHLNRGLQLGLPKMK